jgi:hypothetical protein
MSDGERTPSAGSLRGFFEKLMLAIPSGDMVYSVIVAVLNGRSMGCSCHLFFGDVEQGKGE